jgi:2-methylisocitrate lyase-like PEP mutase family enzyme
MVEQALARGLVYAKAGADGVLVPAFNLIRLLTRRP